MSDLSEVLVQIGSLIPRNIRFMVRRKLRCLIATRRRNKFAFLAVCLLVVGEVLWHIHSFQVPRPSRPLDAPFSVQCQEPITNGPRENAAFVMLARNKELEGALQAITSLERQFNRWFHYPIVFINDVPWERDFIDALSKAASGKVQFETIGNDTGMWGFPDWMDKDRARASMKLQEKNKVLYGGMESYHHMCRYNSGKFYDHEALKPYKWYWRVEPDVEFTCAITYDPFVAMAKNKKKYGFVISLWEKGETVPSLFRKISDYKKAHKIPTTNLWKAFIDPSWAPFFVRPFLSLLDSRDKNGDMWNMCHYWSNFEIADMDWYRSPEYRQLFDMLDADGGFYYERWGDAPIHSLAAALLLEPHEVHYFEDIGYVHPPFHSCPANAIGGQLPESTSLGTGLWDVEKPGGIGCRCQCEHLPEKGELSMECKDLLQRGAV